MGIFHHALIAAVGCAALLGACSAPGAAQPELTGRACAFGSAPVFAGARNVGPPSPEAVKIVERITQGVGIRPNFKIFAADIVPNTVAFATIRDGQRYIVYDRASLDWSKGRTKWSDVVVLAHEIGHHLASHLFVSEYAEHDQELEADRFAGFALARLGASQKQATSWYGDWPETPTHPSGARRRKVVEAGWMAGQHLKRLEAEPCTPGWAGSVIDVVGATCRIARSCNSGTPQTRLACEGAGGVWRWMQGSRAE
ncbi:MAG: hypothetical protein KDE25_02850 [Novosphingobium sp.]|nr:hypothetical protein [Novosphingobium sp.]